MGAVETERRKLVVDRILSEVAEAEQCDVLDLPPLYGAVDPDALDRLVESAADIRISFTYDGYRVTVETPDTISVVPNHRATSE